jgi:uncharacterized protein (TIRG00374 family)
VAAAVAAILAFAAWRLHTGHFAWSRFADSFRGLRWPWFVLAILLVFLSYWGRALRWEVMLRPLRRHASLMGLFRATVIGFAAVVLFGRPGEIVRPYLIATRFGVSFPSQMAAWLLERILDLLMVLALFGFALAVVPASRLHLGPGLQFVFRAGGYLCAAIGALCVALLLGFRHFAAQAEDRIAAALTFLPGRFQDRIRSLISAFAEGMTTTGDASYFRLLIAYSLLEWAILISATFCFFKAIPATSHFSLSQVTVFQGLVSFGGAVQVPGIGGGFQVASILVLSEVFGLPVETASGVSLLLWAAFYLPVIPVGLALGLREGVEWNKIKQIRENMKV